MTYLEQLQDPRWQKKRLEVLSAADFHCRSCGTDEKMLHVHHRYYKKGCKAWEYEDDAYECLCVDCHKVATSRRESLDHALKLCLQLDEVIGYVDGLNFENCFLAGYEEYSQKDLHIELEDKRILNASDWFEGFCYALRIDFVFAYELIPDKLDFESFVKAILDCKEKSKKAELQNIRSQISNHQ